MLGLVKVCPYENISQLVTMNNLIGKGKI